MTRKAVGTTHLCPIDIRYARMTFFGKQNEGKVVCSTSQQSLKECYPLDIVLGLWASHNLDLITERT